MWQKLATNLTDYAYHGFQERHHSESKREQDVNALIVSHAFFRGSRVEIGRIFGFRDGHTVFVLSRIIASLVRRRSLNLATAPVVNYRTLG